MPQLAVGGEAVSELDAEADELIADCGGDARAAMKALFVTNAYLERELELARVAISSDFSRP